MTFENIFTKNNCIRNHTSFVLLVIRICSHVCRLAVDEVFATHTGLEASGSFAPPQRMVAALVSYNCAHLQTGRQKLC